jgi:parallel beta-helix repeat protein
MANTYQDYTATAGQTDFAFNFPYLEDEHVIVEIEGVDQTITTNYTIETSPTQRINLSNPTTALAGGELVRIKRRSAPNTNLVDFVNGSVLTETELDRAYLHNRYLAEEATEGADAGLKELEGSTNFNANNKQIKNLADGTLATDAVNKQYVDTQIALTDTNLAGFYKSTHTGNAVDNVFTLSFTPQTTDAKAYIVSIDGLVQVPDTDYTIGATAITFNTIPANSTEICVVATAAASVATVNEAQVTSTGSSTARTIADRFGDVVNVLDFIPSNLHAEIKGGTPTTAVDSYIQSAIDQAASAGTVYFPNGIYLISSSLLIPTTSSITLLGNGTKTTLRPTTTTVTPTIDVNGNGGPSVIFKGLKFEGITGSYGSSIGIGGNGNGFIIENCWFAGLLVGVKIVGSFISIQNSVFEYCFKAIEDETPIENTYANNTFYRNETDIEIDGTSSAVKSVIVTGVNAIATKTRVVNLINCVGVSVSNVVAEDDSSGDTPDIIHFAGTSTYNIVNNVTSNGFGRYLIFLEGSNNDFNTFNNLSCTGLDRGIFVSVGNYNRFNNIMFEGCDRGVFFDSSPYNYLSNASLHNCNYGIYIFAATDCRMLECTTVNSTTNGILEASTTTVYSNGCIYDSASFSGTHKQISYP